MLSVTLISGVAFKVCILSNLWCENATINNRNRPATRLADLSIST